MKDGCPTTHTLAGAHTHTYTHTHTFLYIYIYQMIVVKGAYFEKMNTIIRVQTLNDAVCISHSPNLFRKCGNTAILSSVISR